MYEWLDADHPTGAESIRKLLHSVGKENLVILPSESCVISP